MSDIAEFTEGTFQTVIDDPAMANADRDKVRRVLLCTGKVYYTLRDARTAAERDGDVAIVRVEQLYPFPEAEILGALAKYPRKQEVCWVQEEPQNRGAWTFMQPRLRAMLPDTLVNYIGREAAASPATGSMKEHIQEEREIAAAALDVPPQKKSAIAEKVVAPGSGAVASDATRVS
jgi:2-oxoglutarate dehydrogenase complex dehydrogenase (E1) component-like enzyme